MGLIIFLAGAAAGLMVGRYPNQVARGLVKAGLTTGSKLREFQEKIAEDIEDHVAAVKAESSEAK